MAGLYWSELSDEERSALPIPEYAIGDQVCIAKIILHKTDGEDTRAAFLAALGQVLPIAEINFWEMTKDPDDSADIPAYHITYEFEVSHLTGADGESIFLTVDEIERTNT